MRKAVIVVETLPIRYRDDGTAPTTSVGMLVFASATVNPIITVCGQRWVSLGLSGVPLRTQLSQCRIMARTTRVPIPTWGGENAVHDVLPGGVFGRQIPPMFGCGVCP